MTNLATIPLNDDLGQVLRSELLSWPGITIRSMMGCLAFLRGKHMVGCYVNRDLSKKKPKWMNRAGESTLAWVRLRSTETKRALARPNIQPCRTGARNWIEISLQTRKSLDEAIYWFSVAYKHPPNEPVKKREHKITPQTKKS